MHLYFYVRGKFEQVKLWESHAQAAYWKWRRTNLKTGKEEVTIIQGGLRPSVLGAYEYVFPEEALAEVLSYFGITSNTSYSFKGILGLEVGLKTRHFLMRKIFGAKKIPKKILEQASKIPNAFTTDEFERCGINCIIPGIGIHVIGIKKDEKRDFPQAGYYQEAL